MTSETYDPVAKTLHWLMAVLIVGLWLVGLVMEGLPKGDLRAQVFGIHKAFGVITMALVTLRLAWRMGRGAPSLPATMGRGEQWMAIAAHGALYALMVLLPCSGIIMSQSGGRDVAVFGYVIPMVVGKDEGLHEFMEEAHAILAWALAAIFVGHVAAALRHHLVLKDAVLRRMLPTLGR
ncbi:MAG TPA: cytochrome b [Candidatus Omnitrophota bacterium]|nr:cytochrome b [Candidatus Omnitrophota bacterium]